MIAVSWGEPLAPGEASKQSAPTHSMDAIISQVSLARGISIRDLMSDRRDRRTAHARFECYWRAKRETPLTLMQIGLALGRDHTSVIHGIRRFEDLNGIAHGPHQNDQA